MKQKLFRRIQSRFYELARNKKILRSNFLSRSASTAAFEQMLNQVLRVTIRLNQVLNRDAEA